MIELRGPDGDPLPMTAAVIDGRRARFELTAADWAPMRAAGLLHTDRSGTAPPALDRSRPVTVEAELEPGADDPTDAGSWWATSATQAVDLPDDLDGALDEGEAFPPPPWAASVEAAWAAVPGEPLLDLVTGVFLDQGWEVRRPDPDATVLEVPVPDAEGTELWIRTAEAQQLVTVFTVLRAEVPAEKVGAVVELAARMNAGVAVGSYEANPDTGLLSFKTGIDVEGDRLSPALVRQLVGTALVAAERARPLLDGVLDGRFDPRAAAGQL